MLFPEQYFYTVILSCEKMKKKSFVQYCRISFLALVFISFSGICTAPAIGYRAKMENFRKLSEYVSREHYNSEFTRFIKDLGKSESGNNWQSVNLIGCFGEWQFAEKTLHYLGHKQITARKFKKDPSIFPPELQLQALKSLIRVNLISLKEYERFVGDTIRGVVITRSGMIAASHLGGARSLKLFLNSRGRINKADVLGTSIADYLLKFSYYDLDSFDRYDLYSEQIISTAGKTEFGKSYRNNN